MEKPVMVVVLSAVYNGNFFWLFCSIFWAWNHFWEIWKICCSGIVRGRKAVVVGLCLLSSKISKEGGEEMVVVQGVQNQSAESFQWLQLVLKEDVSWNNLSCNLLSSPSNSLLSLLNSSELNFPQIILYADCTWAAKVKFTDRAPCHPSTHTPSQN